ncbi:hypothetical protein [Chryseobacterium flavum]|uniref:hypothetical protein n=1 Tax=Chryseobacterium flavum TaxID=415851 RepID=UPI002FDA4D6E
MKHILAMMIGITISGGINQAEAKTLKDAKPVKHIEMVGDSASIIQLKKELSKLKPLDPDTFKSKIKKEISGFTLAEVEAYNEPETGSSCTAQYINGEKSVYLMITDGAGKAASQVAESLISNLDFKQYVTPDSKTKIIDFKGYPAFFDASMYAEDKFVSIQYLEGKRYYITGTGNNITLEELKAILEKFSL